ncbi:MAG: DUF6273 domain-containing protein [Erysipelotrichaceae bacterium]|nr:DUF6273 domain-containing protein [Erysipelotrichaceae bacterium]
MKKNSKRMKKVAPIALTGLILVGASAWLTNNETQTGVNKITTGSVTLKFVDSAEDTRPNTTININGAQVIPMTEAFATANLNPYKFALDNQGNVDLDYDVYLINKGGNFGAETLAVDYNGNESAPQLITALTENAEQKIFSGKLKAGEKIEYNQFRIYAVEGATNEKMLVGEVGRNASFQLEVRANQSQPEQVANTLKAGQKLTIADKEYTVIENVQGTQYKVLATDLANNGQGMAFGNDLGSINYATSPIASYLDGEYYNGLDTNVKNAIVEQAIQQKYVASKDDSSGSYIIEYDESQTRNVGTHKVFIPSYDEITKIYGTTQEGLKAYSNGKDVWLREFYGNGLVYVVSSVGSFNYYPPINSKLVRPAFVIDLSNVDYNLK